MAENSTSDKPLNRQEQAMAAAIEALLSCGFAPDGETREEIARIPTKRSPLYGHSGGELAKLGRQPWSERRLFRTLVSSPTKTTSMVSYERRLKMRKEECKTVSAWMSFWRDFWHMFMPTVWSLRRCIAPMMLRKICGRSLICWKKKLFKRPLDNRSNGSDHARQNDRPMTMPTHPQEK
jgi:hypothetical protein